MPCSKLVPITEGVYRFEVDQDESINLLPVGHHPELDTRYRETADQLANKIAKTVITISRLFNTEHEYLLNMCNKIEFYFNLELKLETNAEPIDWQGMSPYKSRKYKIDLKIDPSANNRGIFNSIADVAAVRFETIFNEYNKINKTDYKFYTYAVIQKSDKPEKLKNRITVHLWKEEEKPGGKGWGMVLLGTAALLAGVLAADTN